jgi:hypothetical protein
MLVRQKLCYILAIDICCWASIMNKKFSHDIFLSIFSQKLLIKKVERRSKKYKNYYSDTNLSAREQWKGHEKIIMEMKCNANDPIAISSFLFYAYKCTNVILSLLIHSFMTLISRWWCTCSPWKVRSRMAEVWINEWRVKSQLCDEDDSVIKIEDFLRNLCIK